MKKVMAFGTFDLIHPGHLHMLKEAKEYGDYLVVIVARDETVKEVKGKKPLRDEHSRLEDVKNLNIADEVKLGYTKDKYKIIREEEPDVIALGYDQLTFVKKLEDNIKDEARIVRLSPYRPDLYKSSKLKDEIL